MLRRSFLQATLAFVPFSAVIASAINDQKLTVESLRTLTKEVFDNEPDRKDIHREYYRDSWVNVFNEVIGYFPNATTSDIREKFTKVKEKVILRDKKSAIYRYEKWFYSYMGLARLSLYENNPITNQTSEPIKGKLSKGIFYSFPPSKQVSPFVKITDKDLT